MENKLLRSKLVELAQKQTQMNALKSEIESLKGQVISNIEGPKEIEVLGVAKFTIYERTTYTYDGDIQIAEEELKEQKREAKARGECEEETKLCMRINVIDTMEL